MSIIRAGTTTTTALTSIGNTDGTIQLQVNGTTPSVTLNTLGAVGVGASPNFGTSGQALVSAGSTAAPAWGNVQAPLVSGTNIKTINGGSVLGSGDLAVGGGSWIWLSTVTSYGSATVDIETTFDSTYDTYVIVVNGMLPSTNAALSRARLKIGGSYQTSGYVGMYGNPDSVTANAFNSTVSTTASPAAHITLSSAAGQTNETWGGSSFMFRVYNPSSTTVRKAVDYDGWSIARADNSYRHERLIGSARFNTNESALTGVRFFYSTGDVAAGTFRLYGIKKS
jgi:hypothetical protein